MEVERLRGNILKELPNLQYATADLLANELHAKGLNSEKRLGLVKVEDLGHLNLFDARQLVETWKTQAAQPVEAQNIPEQQGQQTRQAMNVFQRFTDWNFQINWPDLYNISINIKEKLKKGKKLTKYETKELVKRLVKQVKDEVPHANRRTFVKVAEDLSKKYPMTFISRLGQGGVNKSSICFKMQTKFDNDRRCKRRKGVPEVEAPHIKPAYGCTKWQLAHLPPGETEESQEQHRLSLQVHFEEVRPNAWDMDMVKNKMDLTYGMLRKEINKQAEKVFEASKGGRRVDQRAEQDPDNDFTTTDEIRNRWPFLYRPAIMMNHFETLTGVNFHEKLSAFMQGPMENFLEYLTASANKGKKKILKKMKKAKQKFPSDYAKIDMTAVLLFLTRRFEEDQTHLWQILDEHVRENDIPNNCQLPKTPCLVIAGGKNIFHATGKIIYFCMDQTVLGTADTIEEGISMLFSSYYIFNIEYAAQAQVTLEFIQRFIAEINPPRGNKRPPKRSGGRTSYRMIHAKLQCFGDNFDRFLAEKSFSSSSNDDTSI